MVEYNRSSLRKRQKPAVLRCQNYSIDDVSNASFSGLLTKIGEGKELSGDEIRVLTDRFVTREQAAIQCPMAVRLFFSNNDVDVHNRMVAQSCEYKHDSVAIHLVTGHRSRQEEREALARIQDLSRAESGNLPSVVTFCTKRPYMLLKNIDVTDGLVNDMHGVVPSTNVNEQNASEPPRAVLMETPKLEILKRLLFGGTAILYPPKASHRSEGDHEQIHFRDDFTRGPVDGAAPGLACDLGQRVQTSPEPACEMDEVTEKSVQVQLYTRHEASQANENKILSTSATQTEPHAFSSEDLRDALIRNHLANLQAEA
ncbi:hypothetical protein MRX96_038455 [Rhipicephalus microplus]